MLIVNNTYYCLSLIFTTIKITNLDAIKPVTNTISEETLMLIKYPLFEEDKGLLNEIVFKNREQNVVWCVAHLMWECGQVLLKSHSDVIFCDSIWNISKE